MASTTSTSGEAEFANFLSNAKNELLPDAKTKNANVNVKTDTERRRDDRRRKRAIRRNGGRAPARSKLEMLATRKWQRSKEALEAAKLEWWQGGGKPAPAKVDPDPTRTHMLPPKRRRGPKPAATRSQLIQRRKETHLGEASNAAPTKETSIHPANLPKMATTLKGVGWWDEERNELLRGLDRGAGTKHWKRDDGRDQLNATVVDGCFNQAEDRGGLLAATTHGRWAMEFPRHAEVALPVMDDEGHMVVKVKRGGTPRLPPPKMQAGGKRVMVSSGLVKEVSIPADPFKKRGIQKEEIRRATLRRKGVSHKITTARPATTGHSSQRRRALERSFTTSVLMFGPMTQQDERFPKPSHLDEFGKSMAWDPEEYKPVPSMLSGRSWRLTRSWGPGPNGEQEPSHMEDDEEEPGMLFGSSIQLPPPGSAPAHGTRGGRGRSGMLMSFREGDDEDGDDEEVPEPQPRSGMVMSASGLLSPMRGGSLASPSGSFGFWGMRESASAPSSQQRGGPHARYKLPKSPSERAAQRRAALEFGAQASVDGVRALAGVGADALAAASREAVPQQQQGGPRVTHAALNRKGVRMGGGSSGNRPRGQLFRGSASVRTGGLSTTYSLRR